MRSESLKMIKKSMAQFRENKLFRKYKINSSSKAKLTTSKITYISSSNWFFSKFINVIRIGNGKKNIKIAY